MSLLDRAKKDAQRILTDLSGFAVELTISDNFGNSATIAGVNSNHHFRISQENLPVNSKKASISVSEQALESEGYPVRDNDNEVDLANHFVEYKDSTGVEKTYLVAEAFPDETVGVIVLMLQDYA